MTEVEIATAVDDELCTSVARLIPQLSRSAPPPGADVLGRMVSDPATTLFLARSGGTVVGMLTLASFQVPTGLRSWIEDVVVDEAARGQGVAVALVQAALDEAARLGSRTVDLTSRPHREAANRLYQRMGFEVRETNVYRHSAEGFEDSL